MTNTFVKCFICAGFAITQATAQTTTVNLSGSNCIPRSAGAFQGSGSDGFQWDDTGAALNFDDNDNEVLVCTIPFDPTLRRSNGTIPYLEVTVDVIDGHTTNAVRATLYGQSGNVSSAALASASTNKPRGRQEISQNDGHSGSDRSLPVAPNRRA